jgi:peptidoglycan/LPS O-acetylase OafA/YrhL
LRALAIALVLGQHLQMGGWIGGFDPSLGRLGVALFFALSGYLITGILLDTGVTLKRFYLRRSLRIFPASYAYLSVVLVLLALGLSTAPWKSFLAASTYLMNFYHADRGWSLQHLWSLAVEEQFYLLWPLALRLLGRKLAGFALLGILLGWPIQRYLRQGVWGHRSFEAALFAVTFDAIFWGCLFALWQRGRNLERAQWLRGRLSIAIPVLVIALLYAKASAPPVVIIPWLRNGSLAWIIYWVAKNAHHPLTSILEWPVLVWLGRRSYSLYLWHLIFMDPRMLAWYSAPVAVALGLLSAELSYRFIERPVLRWRDLTTA